MRIENSTVIGGIAITHLLATPVLFSKELVLIVQRGIIDVLAGDPAIGVAVWHFISGVMFLMCGILIHALQRNDIPTPPSIGWLTLTIGLVGACLEPAGGFWLLIMAGVYIIFNRKKKLW